MAKRKPELTAEAVKAAIESAKNGKGGPLAKLIKGCSLEDLTKGLGLVGRLYRGHVYEDFFMIGLSGALAAVDGRRRGRAEFSQWKKEFRKQQPTEAETSHG
ncbi:MAG: hypothetical protein ABL901_09120 [Hyphomicrobiaceae bacterium]